MFERLMKNRPAEQDQRLLTEINKLAVGQAELLKRLVRVETRLCILLESFDVEPHSRQKGTV